MSTPDDTQNARSASSGTTRTPPPRTRRGAPTSRTAFDDPSAEPEAPPAEVAPDPADSSTQGSRGTKSTTSKRSTSKGTRGAPASDGDGASDGSRAFDWETHDDIAEPEPTPARARRTTTNRDATIAAGAAEPYGDPVEPEIAFEPTPAPRPVRAKSAKRPERRFRQTVQKVDLWSVTKMALCFYVSAMGVVVVSLIALWVVADSAGIIDNVENFIGDLFSSEDFHFVSGQVLRGAVLVGVVIVALLVAFTIIAASFYNIFAELFGGVEIVIREEEQPPKR